MKNYCLLRDSDTLKVALRKIIEMRGYNIKEVGELSNIDTAKLHNYFNYHHSEFYRARTKSVAYISQKELLFLSKLLGLKVTLKIEQFTDKA